MFFSETKFFWILLGWYVLHSLCQDRISTFSISFNIFCKAFLFSRLVTYIDKWFRSKGTFPVELLFVWRSHSFDV